MHLKADGTEGEVATAVQYREDGFTAVAELFTRQEVAWIARACVAAGAAASPKAIREPNGDMRSRFFERGDCAIIDAVVRQRRLVGRAQALVGSRVYAYQVMVNSKRALQVAKLKRSDIEHVALQHADGRAALKCGGEGTDQLAVHAGILRAKRSPHIKLPKTSFHKRTRAPNFAVPTPPSA